MNKDFYQACYTRIGTYSKQDVASDAAIATGYQNVHCSYDIPQNVMIAFENRRKAVSPKTRKFLKSHSEAFFCENNIFGIEQLRFDAVDDAGRSVLFDQTFLIPDAYNCLKKPEQLLYIDDSNFGTDIEADKDGRDTLLQEKEGVIRWCLQHTAQIPRNLNTSIPEGNPEISDFICSKYGMSDENISLLVQAVYFHLFSTNASNYIFVKTDGSRSMMRDLMYIFLSRIPFSMRTKISFGEYCYKDQKGCNIFFTDKIPERQVYVDPIFRDENVFKGKQEELFGKRFPYIAETLLLTDEKRNNYYSDLEGMLLKLGAEKSYDQKCLHLAHQLIVNNHKKPECVGDILYDILSLPLEKNTIWQNYVTELLKSVVQYDILIPEVTQEMLSSLLKEDRGGSYQEILISYEASKLLRQGEDKACESLMKFDENDEQYYRLRKALVTSREGQRILHKLYIIKLEKLMEPGTFSTYSDLIRISRNVSDIEDNKDIVDMVKTQVLSLALKNYQDGVNSIEEDERNLAETLHTIDVSDTQNEKYQRQFRDTINQLFLEKMDENRYINGDYKRFYQMNGYLYPESNSVLNVLQEIDKDNYVPAIGYLNEHKTDENYKKIFEYFLSRAKELEKAECFYVPISFWLKLSEALKTDVVDLMVESRAFILFNEDCLSNDFDDNEDAKYWTDPFLYDFYRRLCNVIKDKPYLRKCLSESLKTLKAEIDWRKKHKNNSGKRQWLKGFFNRS